METMPHNITQVANISHVVEMVGMDRKGEDYVGVFATPDGDKCDENLSKKLCEKEPTLKAAKLGIDDTGNANILVPICSLKVFGNEDGGEHLEHALRGLEADKYVFLVSAKLYSDVNIKKRLETFAKGKKVVFITEWEWECRSADRFYGDIVSAVQAAILQFNTIG